MALTSKDIVPLKEMRAKLTELAEEVCAGREKIITRNFQRNLDAIQFFLQEAEAAAAFETLLDDLFDQVLPSLESFPDLGADLFRHRPASHEVQQRAAALRARLGPNARLRELIRGDYLLLYARGEDELFLLAIKNFSQLSCDFPADWSE